MCVTTVSRLAYEGQLTTDTILVFSCMSWNEFRNLHYWFPQSNNICKSFQENVQRNLICVEIWRGGVGGLGAESIDVSWLTQSTELW